MLAMAATPAITNTTDQGLEQQRFNSHSSGGWEVRDRGPAWSGSGEGPLPVVDRRLLVA